MLDTSDACRSTLSEALIPPEGFAFVEGVFTAYSADLPTILSLPAQLLLSEQQARSEILKNPVALLSGIRRLRDNLSIFCQAGAVHAPKSEHLLYALLHPMLHEVRAPRERGVFHPKIQLLHFEDDKGTAHLRLLVLSRNLTRDRSWDLSLRLDGRRGRRTAGNNAICELLGWLGEQDNLRTVDTQRLARLSELLKRTHWDRPAPYDTLVALRCLGLRGRGWIPDWPGRTTEQLAVVSPFVTESVVRDLADNVRDLAILISRADELQKLSDEAIDAFDSVWVLRDAALRDDGEDDGLNVLRGLHAKAYLMKVGWKVRAVVGSANATYAALGEARNVEVIAVLEGSRARVGMPDRLVSEQGLLPLLMPFCRVDPDPDEVARQETLAMLDETQRQIGQLDLVARYQADGSLRIGVEAGEVTLPEGLQAHVWPVSWPEAHGRDAAPLLAGGSLTLSFQSLASLTGLLAFRLSMDGENKRFVRIARLVGVPALQESELIRAVLRSPGQFLAYLRFLLGDHGGEGEGAGGSGAEGSSDESAIGFGTHALLETLTKTLSRSPERLHEVADLVRHVREHTDAGTVLPPDFLETWAVFEQVLPPRKRGRTS